VGLRARSSGFLLADTLEDIADQFPNSRSSRGN
jgi:hypothetical protein